MNPKWRHFFWKISLLSPLVWGLILIGLALFLVWLPWDFTKKLALLPTIVAFLFLYQAIFKGKMY